MLRERQQGMQQHDLMILKILALALSCLSLLLGLGDYDGYDTVEDVAPLSPEALKKMGVKKAHVGKIWEDSVCPLLALYWHSPLSFSLPLTTH